MIVDEKKPTKSIRKIYWMFFWRKLSLKEMIQAHHSLVDYRNLLPKQDRTADCLFVSDDQLLITMLDIFQAGIETTSTILSWTILFLILNPHVQEKLYEEISQTLPKGKPITLDYKNKLANCISKVSV